MANKTSAQFDEQIQHCREIFRKKTHDYGTSWRVLRPKSLTDQLFIKAQRIQTLEEKETQMVAEGIEVEFIALVNYAIMGLIQMELSSEVPLELKEEEALRLFDKQVAEI